MNQLTNRIKAITKWRIYSSWATIRAESRAESCANRNTTHSSFFFAGSFPSSLFTFDWRWIDGKKYCSSVDALPLSLSHSLTPFLLLHSKRNSIGLALEFEFTWIGCFVSYFFLCRIRLVFHVKLNHIDKWQRNVERCGPSAQVTRCFLHFTFRFCLPRVE